MPESNKSFRIKTTVNDGNSSLMVNLDQSYNTFEILSLKMNQSDMYKLDSANYGVIVGRVLANGNFGVPNAKISIFIEGNFENETISAIYPYTSTVSQNQDGIKYNLLPDEKVDNCHQVVGTFPNKTYLLDNDVLVEVFDTYYKYTTRTNNSGDYIIAGVPVGNQTLHMDLDLSDCGILSQRPRDFVYKGYTIEQFDNPNQFKTDKNLNSLSQIFSQDQVVNVIPFWGNENQGETIGITRADIEITFKFEPTCVFMGSLVADNSSNGISKKCVPTNQMGAMDELTTGEGTIEMIRYTPGGNIEEFQIKGTELIDGNGIWCYQIPMNLDYMMTDEYGNMVPTDDPNKGIPTRTRARFRISMQDMENNTDNYFRAKVLVPHNPQNYSGTTGQHEDYDYEFGSKTREDSFRDLLWNNVYTVKSYIPRFQKSETSKSTQRFTGIKHCNYYGNNNPMPYNNIRIKLPLMFTLICALIKTYIRVVDFVNRMINAVGRVLGFVSRFWLVANEEERANMGDRLKKINYIVLADGLCPDLENWYFSPNKDGNYIDNNINNPNNKNKWWFREWNFLQQTFDSINSGETEDTTSIDFQNSDTESVCLTTNIDYLVSCIEMALAQEYKVINFDFYNDWINGVIYMPRWMRFVRQKRTFLFGLIKIKSKVRACMDNTSIFNKTRYYTQQCSLSYGYNNSNLGYTNITTPPGCVNEHSKKQKCHKKGNKSYPIFGGSKNSSVNGNGGIVHENETIKKEYVYYLKPCEWSLSGKKVNLFANDIVLLGSLLDCNLYGIPQAFKYLTSSSYIMPTNLALTNMDDEGYLYADGEGTICSDKTSAATLTQVDNSFMGMVNYYSTSESPLEYNEYDDTIPMTEAAGIAWNYTGPGQGSASTNVSESLYMPGGHFLGISCVNSETNIKSCVNLERICEIGSNMSQRREEVRKIVGSTNELQYRYFVPSGLIANDDINGGTFRSMFATMNQNRLLCTDKVDEKTGYPIYNFMYLRTNGFDGSLKNKIDGDSNWNKQISVEDEYSVLNSCGSTISKDDNFDNNETANTYVRTIEEAKMDYYQFRLGLNSLTDKKEQLKKFLYSNNDIVQLPQYENSFYFYFGLKDGATAFDEFLKQFYSTCDSTSVLKSRLSLTKTKETQDMCSFTSDITIRGTGTYGTVNGYYEYVDKEGNPKKVVIDTIQSINGTFNVTITRLPFGEYTFTFTDELGATSTERFIVGENVITSEFSSKGFEFRTDDMSESQIVENGKTYDCGYVLLENLNYSGTVYPWENICSGIVIVANYENGTKKYYGGKGDNLPPEIRGSSVGDIEPLGEDGKIYVWKSDILYDIYLTSMSDDCSGYQYLNSVYVEGIDNYDLYLGSKLLPYSTKLSTYSGEWWRSIGDNDNIEQWAKRYALFNRIDNSASTFTNKILAFNNKNRVLDTALFGQPERSIEPKLYPQGVLYENDNMGNYNLSDTIVIPTTLTTSSTSLRRLFGEMAVNGNSIISNKITTSSATFTEVSVGRNYFTVNINSDKLLDNHGCIAVLDDGRILYCIKDGNDYYFDDNIPDTDSSGVANVSIYPIFYYPVIYRPFYANANIAFWSNQTYTETIDITGGTNYIVDYNQDKYKALLSVKNGLTYRNKFDSIKFNDIELDSSGVANDMSGLTQPGEDYDCYTDRTKDRVYVQVTDNLSKKNEILTSFNYSVSENAPETGETGYDLLTTPKGIDLITINDNIESSLANNIFWKLSGGDTGSIIAMKNDINDVSDGTKTYYLINNSNVQCPLIEDDIISTDISNTEKLYLYEFTVNSDSLLHAENTGETGTYVNKPGTLVDVKVVNDEATFVYLSSNAPDGVQLRKTVSFNTIEGECGLSPIKTYRWNSYDSPETFINNVFNSTTKEEIFNGETSYEHSSNNTYCVCIKENKTSDNGWTRLVKIYPKITIMTDYDDGGHEPDMKLIPSGTTGNYQ